jgi:hypothetical protein
MQTEKEYMTAAADTFDETTSGLLTTLAAFDATTINRAPSNGGWTAGQVGEHLLKSYGIAELLERNAEPAGRPAHEKIEQLKSIFLNFEIKLSSPPDILPSASPKDRDLLLKALSERIRQIRRLTATKDPTGLCAAYELPVMGALTRLEWIYFAVFHTRRHIRQLQNLMKETGEAGNSRKMPAFR